MVTRLSDGRAQTTLKGREITPEWELTVKKAAARCKESVAAFTVRVTTQAAQAVLKGDDPDAAVTAALPARLEDVAAGLQEQIDARLAALEERLAGAIAAAAERPAERPGVVEATRARGRWYRR